MSTLFGCILTDRVMDQKKPPQNKLRGFRYG
jgi:hypothetical protein